MLSVKKPLNVLPFLQRHFLRDLQVSSARRGEASASRQARSYPCAVKGPLATKRTRE